MSSWVGLAWLWRRADRARNRGFVSWFGRWIQSCQYLVQRGEVAVRVTQVGCGGEHGVRRGCRWQSEVQLARLLQGEADVLVHQFDVEPSLGWQVEQQRHASGDQRRADRAGTHDLRSQ